MAFNQVFLSQRQLTAGLDARIDYSGFWLPLGTLQRELDDVASQWGLTLQDAGDDLGFGRVAWLELLSGRRIELFQRMHARGQGSRIGLLWQGWQQWEGALEEIQEILGLTSQDIDWTLFDPFHVLQCPWPRPTRDADPFGRFFDRGCLPGPNPGRVRRCRGALHALRRVARRTAR
jgi:hypothetical protein